MEPRPSDDLDRTLRESFVLEPEALRRVVAGARASAGRHPRRRWALRAALASAAVLVPAAAAFWWSGPQVPVEPAAPAMSGVLYDGVLVLTFPDESVSIIGADRGDERPPEGFGIVLVNGEIR